MLEKNTGSVKLLFANIPFVAALLIILDVATVDLNIVGNARLLMLKIGFAQVLLMAVNPRPVFFNAVMLAAIIFASRSAGDYRVLFYSYPVVAITLLWALSSFAALARRSPAKSALVPMESSAKAGAHGHL
ncbi:hypothetical protein K8I61_10135 [bacterium]|nr:hypothetical protein [bacterium]